MKKIGFAVLTAAVLLSGCSTAVNRTVQDIEVITPGVTEAECDMRTPKDRYQVITPNTVKVEKARYDITITCYKQDYITAVETIKSKFAGSSVGNIFTGIIPGYFVDWNTGAMYEYPEKVVINMKPLGGEPSKEIDTTIYQLDAPQTPEPAPPAGAITALPEDVESPADAAPAEMKTPPVDDKTIVVPGPDAKDPAHYQDDLPEEEKDSKDGDSNEMSPQFDINENPDPTPLKPVPSKGSDGKSPEPTSAKPEEKKKEELGQDITIDDLNPKAGDEPEPQPIPLLKRISN